MDTGRKALWERLRSATEVVDLDGFNVPQEARKSFFVAMGEWIVGVAPEFFHPPGEGTRRGDPEKFVETIVLRLGELTDAYNGKQTQSPIEDLLYGSLLWLDIDWAGFPRVDPLRGPEDNHKQYGLSTDKLVYHITPQANVAGYRVDFLIWFQLKTVVGGIAIECDGHAFHERTKEQAARDKGRDRACLTAGYPVMRFTGSEIFANPGACANQVREALAEVLFRVSKDGGMFA